MGTFMQWQLYVQKENKLYTKLSTTSAIYWDDAGENDDPIIKVEVNKKVATIFGYECDEVVIKDVARESISFILMLAFFV